MPIPKFDAVMLPLLRSLADGEEHTIRALTQSLGDEFGLTAEERAELLPRGSSTVFRNRVGWAKTYLKYASLLDNPTRGRVRITAAGRAVLGENPSFLDVQYLRRFPSFASLFPSRNTGEVNENPLNEELGDEGSATPLEQLSAAFETIQDALKQDLLTRLKQSSPSFFEKAVVRLLIAMGYGGVGGSGEVTGKSGDGGIDGVIRQDKLGLDIVCIQAKRWENTVGRQVVQQFVGSMDFVRARKGVIFTTSSFSSDAISFIERIEGKKVVLVDGVQLAEYMIFYNVGVSSVQTIEIKEISNDFFDEDEE